MQKNTVFSLLVSLIRSKTKYAKDLQKGMLIRDLMALDETLKAEDVARLVQLSLPWVSARKSLADAFFCGDALLRRAIGSGRIPTASAFYEFQRLEKDTQVRLLKSDLPELSSKICRQAKVLQDIPMSDAEFIMHLSERDSGENLDTESVPHLTLVSDVAAQKDKDSPIRRKPSLVSCNQHPVEHYQTREETLSLPLPKPRNRVLAEFDATVVQDFLRAHGRPAPEDRLELTRAFADLVKAIAAASRPAQ
jgi:hypothetical protein